MKATLLEQFGWLEVNRNGSSCEITLRLMVTDTGRAECVRDVADAIVDAINAAPATAPAPGKWSARCDCYKGHNSASGRCNARDVTDPQAAGNDAVLCERCRRECRGNGGGR